MSERKNFGALGSRAKQIVLNVCNYFLNEYQRQRDSYIDRTAKATGVSRSTVYRIRKEQKDTGMLGSPRRSERGASLLMTLMTLLYEIKCTIFILFVVSCQP